MSVYQTLKLRGHDPLTTIAEALRTYVATGKLPPLPPPLAANGYGVAELIDHRGTGLNAERRLRFAWFGEGSSAKARTFRVAKDMLSGRR